MTAVVGSRQVRREDPALLTGEARFVDDLVVPGALHATIVRSPYAHARIRSIDSTEAQGMPGVVAVFTGADLRGEWENPLPCAWPVTDDMKSPEHWPLAIDEACFVGDGVAVVVAETREQARDAMEAIVVDYDELPVVVDLEAAARDEALVHESLGTNKSYTWSLVPDPASVDQAFAEAEHTIKERYLQQRLIPMAIEPRGVCVLPEPYGGDFTVYSSTQIPHILKVMLGITLGLDEHKLRVVAPSVGGGFGSKLNVYAEEALCLALAKRLQRPVRWNEERTENTQATIAWPRDDPGDRARGRQRRQGHRGAGEPRRRHGRVSPARHARHPAAGRVPVPRRRTTSRRTRSRVRACSRIERRPTRTAARGGPKRPMRSSGRWTRWRARSAWTRPRSGVGISSRRISSRTTRARA